MSKKSILFLFSKDDVRNNVDRHDDDRNVDRRPHLRSSTPACSTDCSRQDWCSHLQPDLFALSGLFRSTLFLPTRRNCVIFAFFVPHALTPPGTATMISLPLNTWIMSLEDQDQEDHQLRQNLCSILAVVSFVIIITLIILVPYSFFHGSSTRCGSPCREFVEAATSSSATPH